MGAVACTKCGYNFWLDRIYSGTEHPYAVCPCCKKMFNTDGKVELNDEQMTRNDEVFGAVYGMCKCLAEDENLPYDDKCLTEIVYFAAEKLKAQGKKVCFPCVVTTGDGSQYIEECWTK